MHGKGYVPTLACPGYVVNTILFPQLPLVCSKLPRSDLPSCFSAGKENAETLTLGLGGKGFFSNRKVDEVIGVFPPVPFGLGGDAVIGGDMERTSPGDMDRIEVLDGLRWKGESSPEGMVSNFCFMDWSCCCVES